MKKILIATTALIATVGAVSAQDITLSGDGRMGVLYDVDGDLLFTSRVRATVNMSGETDGGLTFGGSFGIHDSTGSTAGQSGSMYVSGEFGKISMGDVDGAAKAAVGQIDGISLTGISDAKNLFYVNSGTDVDGDGINDTVYPNPAVLYEFSTGAFSLFASAATPTKDNDVTTYTATDSTGAVVLSKNVKVDGAYAFGVKWGDNGYSIALGYELLDGTYTDNLTGNVTSGIIDQWVIGGSAALGDFTVKANYAVSNQESSQYGISGTYAMDALSVTGFYHHVDFTNVGLKGDTYGLGASYDLGGGLSIKGGVVQLDEATTIADFGLSMSF